MLMHLLAHSTATLSYHTLLAYSTTTISILTLHLLLHSSPRNNWHSLYIRFKVNSSAIPLEHSHQPLDKRFRVSERKELAVNFEQVRLTEETGGAFLDEGSVKVINFLFIDWKVESGKSKNAGKSIILQWVDACSLQAASGANLLELPPMKTRGSRCQEKCSS